MDILINDDKTFENVDYALQKLPISEFNNCEFIQCNFSKTDVNNSTFMDCLFKGCDFSLAKLNNTGIKNIRFVNCRLRGIEFGACNDFLFSASFDNCQLDYSSFYKKKMKKAFFENCSLKQVDFSHADLSGAVFKNCDLLHAIFIQTNLEKADFRTAKGYSFDPEQNKIKKAKFSYSDVGGLLAKYHIDIE